MSDGLLRVLTLIAALGSGLMAGFFFAFSVSVMKALGRLPPAQGIAAMQSINVVVINPVFLIAFFGTAAACVAVAISALSGWSEPGAAYLLAPIAAAVLGGTAISGGVGSMIAVAGAALFLTHLGQILKMMGLTTAIQFMVYGGAIAVGMALAGVRFSDLRDAWARRLGRVVAPGAEAP